jgi:hypothetical protein
MDARSLDSAHATADRTYATYHTAYCTSCNIYKYPARHAFIEGECKCGLIKPQLQLINKTDKFPAGNTLSWNSVPGATFYRIYTTGDVVFVPMYQDTSYDMETIIAIRPGTYDVYVEAVFEDNSTLKSNHVSVIVEKLP